MTRPREGERIRVRGRAIRDLVLFCALMLDGSALTAATVSVQSTVETAPVPHSGDAADDPAIWVDAVDPGQSLIIGTDKLGGLGVYDLTGRQLQYLPDGNMNNVDLRYNFPLGGGFVALVTAGNRTNNSIAIYQVNPATHTLQNVAAGAIAAGLTVYGSCMYRSPLTGNYYFIVNDKSGMVKQWELFDNGAGKVAATLVRSFDVGSQPEGCVADDELRQLYIGEEAVGIWKYGAEPGDGASRTKVDSTTATGGQYLVSNVEGLALYRGSGGAGYLIASSQGNSTFVVYERGAGNAYVKTFQIVAGNGIDGVTGTDGIDVTGASLGPAFPGGVFVAQDGANDGANQNYKLVPWGAILPPSDTSPPSVSITSPGGGATLLGTVTVSAAASDNVGVVGVQFALDGSPLGPEDQSSPYSLSWNTVLAADGAHSLTAVARDSAGNRTTSGAVNVILNNLPTSDVENLRRTDTN